MLDNLKIWMQERIEKDAFATVIEGKKVILKKSRIPILGGEWREIHPPIDEDNNWNIINAIFGGSRNFILLIIVLLIAGMVIFNFREAVNVIKTYHDSACFPAFEMCMKNLG